MVYYFSVVKSSIAGICVNQLMACHFFINISIGLINFFVVSLLSLLY